MRILRSAALAAALLLALAGNLPAETVRLGDKVAVSYTCRLPDGGLVMTSDRDLAKDATAKRSSIFVELPAYNPIHIHAGSGYGGEKFGPLVPMPAGIAGELSNAVLGKEVGAPFKATLRHPRVEGLGESERYLKVFRNTERRKVAAMLKEDYEKLYGQPAKVGDVRTIPGRNTPPFEVISIEELVVNFRYKVSDGMRIDTPFGVSILANKDDEIYFDKAQPVLGYKVLSQLMVGYISEVNDEYFLVDYSHPFGNSELNCDVKVESIVSTEGRKGDAQK